MNNFSVYLNRHVFVMSRRHFEICFLILLRKYDLTLHANCLTICMKCQILFPKENKKAMISLSTAEFGHSTVRVN